MITQEKPLLDSPLDIDDLLAGKPYIITPFPLHRIELEKAAAAFLRFLELPDSIKYHIDLDVAPKHRRGKVGFRHRDPSDHLYNDSKDFFHFHPLILETYKDYLNENPIVLEFLNRAKPIWDATYEVLSQIMTSFESHFPGTYSKIFDTPNVHILLRFLKYNWTESGKYLAKPHYDAGSLSLAIAESCPGLRMGTGPDDLTLIEHKNDQAIFFISSNYKKVIDTDSLSPAWHDVIQMDETQIGKPFSRWAIVAFIDGHGVEALSREETHKWLKV